MVHAPVQVYEGRVLTSGMLRSLGVTSGATLVMIDTRPFLRPPLQPSTPVCLSYAIISLYISYITHPEYASLRYFPLMGRQVVDVTMGFYKYVSGGPPPLPLGPLQVPTAADIRAAITSDAQRRGVTMRDEAAPAGRVSAASLLSGGGNMASMDRSGGGRQGLREKGSVGG